VHIAGLDLAAEPKGSALTILHWSGYKAKVLEIAESVSDEQILRAATSVEKLGIDCALGWPIEFSEFIRSHSDITQLQDAFDGNIDWRRRLAYRETDRQVRQATGHWPLSVSTDRLSMTALRCAGLMSQLRSVGHNVDRAGFGKIVEIYPAASMRIWGLQFAGYRNSSGARQVLIKDLLASTPWLELSGYEDLMIQSCDAFDSVIAAMATMSVCLGKSTNPSDEDLSTAQIEGWIHLPKSSLAEMIH
jgi:predicted nuclease with RNAse H fold